MAINYNCSTNEEECSYNNEDHTYKEPENNKGDSKICDTYVKEAKLTAGA